MAAPRAARPGAHGPRRRQRQQHDDPSRAAASAPPAQRAGEEPRVPRARAAAVRRFPQGHPQRRSVFRLRLRPAHGPVQRDLGPAAPARAAHDAGHARAGRTVPAAVQACGRALAVGHRRRHAAAPGRSIVAQRRCRPGRLARGDARSRDLPGQRGARSRLLRPAAQAHERGDAGQRTFPPAGVQQRAAARGGGRRRPEQRAGAAGSRLPARAARPVPRGGGQHRPAPRGVRHLGGHRLRGGTAARARAAHRAAARLRAVAPAGARAAAPAAVSGADAGTAPRRALAAVAPLCAAVAQGGRAQRRDRRALHRPQPRRVPRHAQARGRRRRGAGRHHAAEIRRHGAGADGLLERLLGRRQLRRELLPHHAAALDGGHQAAGDDGAGDGAAPGRPEERRVGGSLRRRHGAPDPLAGGRHLRQPGAVRAAGAGRAVRWPGGCGARRWWARLGRARAGFADAARARRCCLRRSPACCCSPAR